MGAAFVSMADQRAVMHAKFRTYGVSNRNIEILMVATEKVLFLWRLMTFGVWPAKLTCSPDGFRMLSDENPWIPAGGKPC